MVGFWEGRERGVLARTESLGLGHSSVHAYVDCFNSIYVNTVYRVGSKLPLFHTPCELLNVIRIRVEEEKLNKKEFFFQKPHGDARSLTMMEHVLDRWRSSREVPCSRHKKTPNSKLNHTNSDVGRAEGPIRLYWSFSGSIEIN